MKDILMSLGFSDKSAEIYMRLIEMGKQPASILSSRLGYPKSTVLFLLDVLEKKGIVTKTVMKGTQYFHANIDSLEAVVDANIRNQSQAIKQVIPLLHQIQGTQDNAPKVTLFDGLESCKKAYKRLLTSRTEIYELGNYEDLEKAFGIQYMQEFVAERARKGIQLCAIGNSSEKHSLLKKIDKKSKRSIALLEPEQGKLYSSFSVFDHKIFLLNTNHGCNAILIENAHMAETFRSMYKCMWEFLRKS